MINCGNATRMVDINMHYVALQKTFNGLYLYFWPMCRNIERDLLVDKWFVLHNGRDTSSCRNRQTFRNRFKV